MTGTDTTTAVALVRAFLAADDEGIKAIIDTAAPERLAARLVGLVEHFGTAMFDGDRDRLDQALRAWLVAVQP